MRPACADRGCQPEEKWYALTGRVVDAKVEADGDIHLALQDADGKNAGTVSAEIPVGPKWCEIRKIVFGLLSDMDEFLERMAMLLVVRSEQSNRIAPVHEFFAHVGEAEEIRGALARSERLQDFFDLALEHFARGIELRLRQLAEREKTQPQRPRDGSTAVASSDLVAHALAGAFIGFLNSWLRNGRPLSAKAMDTLFHRFAWAGITSAWATKEVHTS